MRLVELRPKWFAEPGRHGQGVCFDCPCAQCRANPMRAARLAAAFVQPLDGGEPIELGVKTLEAIYDSGATERGKIAVPPGIHWKRSGETFDTLTLFPSLDFSPSGDWHGFLTNGEIR